MEIPNYDVDIKNKKFEQLYSFMPNDTFRMLICGNSGSGKTNLLYHMLIEPLLYYDKIYLYAKTRATISGGLTLNPIVLGVINGFGILLTNFGKMKN